MPEEIRERQRQAMRGLDLDGMVIVAPENVCWTTGTFIPSQKTVRHRHAIVLVPVEGAPEMIVVNIEEGFARANADIEKIIAYNEFDLSRRIADAFAAQGGGALTMLSVTAGERTSMLNAPAGPQEILRGDVVRIDVIGVVDSYVCDVARTAVAGEPRADHAAIWQKLVGCRNLALDMIRPGASAHRVFRVYIEKMDAWGLPTLHFLGHGLGLTLHEEPYLNRYADTALEPGMVLAVEPLVMFPELGMQLEDTLGFGGRRPDQVVQALVGGPA